MGVWPDYSDGTDINALQVSQDGSLVITADDFGGVKLFSAPCVVEDAPFLRHGAHSSHVMAVRFLAGDSRAVSLGGLDHSICQWKIGNWNVSSSHDGRDTLKQLN